MNKECGLVRDLLPLYIDSVCSEESREFIDEHVKDCADCGNMLSDLKNNSLAETLSEEKESVVSHQAKVFKRKSVIAGTVISCILMIPVLVCLIVNIASGHALDWFFIVLSSLTVFASLTVVPLMAENNNFFWTVISFSASLVILLGICCIYSHGDWFFISATSSLFGISVIFAPFLANSALMRPILKNQKALFVLSCDTALMLLMFLSIGMRVRSGEFNLLSFGIIFPVTVFVWVLFAVIRYLRVNGLIKAGICLFISGAFIFFANSITGVLINSPVPLPCFNLSIWSFETLDGNLKLIGFIAGAVLCAAFTVFGILRKKGEADNHEKSH